MVIGFATVAMIALVSVLTWFLGIERLPEPVNPTLGDGGVDAFASLTSGGATDTTRIVQLGELPDELDESSGVAVSRTHEKLMWSHNDGGEGVLFALRPDGAPVGTIGVQGVDIHDWEDIDLAPCPPRFADRRDCLYIADTGNNELQRDRLAIDIVPEPDPSSVARVTVARRIHFRYPDGAADTEALAMSPDGDALLITKGQDGSSRVYRLDADILRTASPSERTVTAGFVAALSLVVDGGRNGITGAAVSPDGLTLAVRNNHSVYLFPMDGLGEAPTLCEIGSIQPQGEGLDFLDDDRLVLTSERIRGRSSVVSLRCP